MSIFSGLFGQKVPVLEVSLDQNGQFAEGTLHAVHFTITEKTTERLPQAAEDVMRHAMLQSASPILQDVLMQHRQKKMAEQLKAQCPQALDQVIPGARNLTGYAVTVDCQSKDRDPQSVAQEQRQSWEDLSVLAFPFGLPSLGLRLTAIIGVLAIRMRDGSNQAICICESADAVSRCARVVMKKA